MSIKGKNKFLPKNVSDKNEMNSLDINIQLLDKLRREEVIKGLPPTKRGNPPLRNKYSKNS